MSDGRDRIFSLRMSSAEREALRRVAAMHGLSSGALVRKMIDAEIERVIKARPGARHLFDASDIFGGPGPREGGGHVR